MEEQSEQNRSEAPTPFKLNKARQKGSVARGLDLGFLTSLAAFVGYIWVFGPSLYASISLAARRAIVTAPSVVAGPNEILALTGAELGAIARPLAFLLGAAFLVVLAFEVVQTGLVFSLEPLRPDLGKMNPALALKRIFSLRVLIETGKSLLKLAVYLLLAGFVVVAARDVAKSAIHDAHDLADAMGRFGFRLLTFFAGAAILFAAIDQLIVRRDFLKKMRMSRREIRREARDREGDPRLKQRRRQIHREYAKLSKSLRNVRGADVLITNPTHYAVALRYDVKTMHAPTIVAQGADRLALRLKRVAFLYNVVIVEDRDLARALYHRCAIDREIPDSYFRQVASIYRNVRSRSPARWRSSAHA